LSAPEIPAALIHYLLVGCYRDADLDLFLLAGAVLRDNLHGLEHLWAELGPVLKSQHRGEAFAEMALRIRDSRRWPDMHGRLACREEHTT
jgi:hypothetical protein